MPAVWLDPRWGVYNLLRFVLEFLPARPNRLHRLGWDSSGPTVHLYWCATKRDDLHPEPDRVGACCLDLLPREAPLPWNVDGVNGPPSVSWSVRGYDIPSEADPGQFVQQALCAGVVDDMAPDRSVELPSHSPLLDIEHGRTDWADPWDDGSISFLIIPEPEEVATLAEVEPPQRRLLLPWSDLDWQGCLCSPEWPTTDCWPTAHQPDNCSNSPMS